MVAMTKRCLRKVLGHSQVDAEELQTILVGTEVALNSRPITQDDENEKLTSAHFLTGGKLTTIQHGLEPVRTESLTRSFQHQRLTETLWRRWQREYLHQLRSYHEVRRPARRGPKFKFFTVFIMAATKNRRLKKKKINKVPRGGNTHEFPVTSVVWAKLRMSPWWPATIINGPSHGIKKNSTSTCMCVVVWTSTCVQGTDSTNH
jgi:hypothetical protein